MFVKELVSIINGEVISGKVSNNKINKIKIDSRLIKKDDLFICIKGNNFDGHDFIETVLEKRPCAIVVDKKKKINTLIPIIKVKNTKKTLQKIGSYIRKKYNNIPLIAITGSNGKTTTKELISDILSTKYNVLKNFGNENNQIGVPLTLFNLDDSYDLIVVEMGMNHLGEIKKLSKMCRPNISIITNIGTAHIGNLKSKKNIFKAKCEIIKGMNEGILIVNGDDEYFKNFTHNKIKTIKCGLDNGDFKAFDILYDKANLIFKIKVHNKTYQVKFNNGYKHLVIDALIAIKIGIIFDININDIIKKIESYKMYDNRMNIINLNNNNKLIADCYNSSYESLIGVLEELKKEEKPKIIILGDILELGKKSKEIHLKIGQFLKEIPSDILLVGPATKIISKIVPSNHFDNNKELINYLDKNIIKDRVILIKGSRKMCLEEITKYLEMKYHS